MVGAGVYLWCSARAFFCDVTEILDLLTLMSSYDWLNSSGSATAMMKKLMREVIDVARALEVPIEHDLIDRLFERILRMPPIVSSM